ncbi:18493_t:CDS:1, partial [Acaulospora morrowiae]
MFVYNDNAMDQQNREDITRPIQSAVDPGRDTAICGETELIERRLVAATEVEINALTDERNELDNITRSGTVNGLNDN